VHQKYKPALFFLIVLVLMAPYLGFAVYCSLHFPPSHWPTWAVNTIAVWFVANFLIVVLLVKRIFRGQVENAERSERVVRTSSIHVAWLTWLVIVWIVFFLYGVKETVLGHYPMGRAIPAGALLLFFIAVFGRSAYQLWKMKLDSKRNV
jgi:hypothetical protein